MSLTAIFADRDSTEALYGSAPIIPERRLVAAVLARAIADCEAAGEWARCESIGDYGMQKTEHDLAAWFLDRPSEGEGLRLCSYAWCCDQLGISDEIMEEIARRCLRALKGEKSVLAVAAPDSREVLRCSHPGLYEAKIRRSRNPIPKRTTKAPRNAPSCKVESYLRRSGGHKIKI